MWLITVVAWIFILVQIRKLDKRLDKLKGLTIDTYKSQHEHILLANRDKNCSEDVSSKTSAVNNSKKITSDRLVNGPCTISEAKVTKLSK